MNIKEFKDKDIISGGLADLSSPEDFDSKELKIGIKHELEHTDDINVAKEIASDHLKEDPHYYSKLQKFEHNIKKYIQYILEIKL